MPDEDIKKRRKKGPSRAKAKKILHEGLSSAGNGFHSDKQRRYIAWVAEGRKKPKKKRKKK